MRTTIITLLLTGSCGTAIAQPKLLKDIYAGKPAGLYTLLNTTEKSGTLYFAAMDTAMNVEVWTTDGTTANTTLLKDIQVGGSSSPSNFYVYNGNVYFSAMTIANGTELFKSDGTAAGTVLLKDIWTGTTSSYPKEFTEMNGSLYFMAENPDSGGYHHVLYKTDGTTAGTAILTNKAWNLGGSRLFKMNNKLYINAKSSTVNTGLELWECDGTDAGTSIVIDLQAGSVSSNPEYLTKIGTNKFVFSAFSTATGYELYISDGTAAGTTMLKDINPGTANSYPFGFKELNGKLYFFANDGTNGRELWVTDGTPTGTNMVANIDGGAGNGNTDGTICVLNNKLFFVGKTSTNGAELWTSDGTAANTGLFKDINTGATDGVISLYADNAIGNKLYFAANNGTNGYEAWETDGTTANTKMIYDIKTGSADGVPSTEYRFVKLNNKILFIADNDTTGNEIWTIDAPVSVKNTTLPAFAVSIYPNPSTGMFTIDGNMADLSLRIYNSLGQLVQNETISKNRIALYNQPVGIYTVELTNTKGERQYSKIQLVR